MGDGKHITRIGSTLHAGEYVEILLFTFKLKVL